MLYLFYGPGPKYSKVKKFTEKFSGEIFKITDLDFSPARLGEFIGAQGLFAEKLLVIFDNVITNNENEKAIEEAIGALASSANTFVFIENEVSPELLLAFRENGEVFLADLKRDNRPTFNIFSLTDAFGSRDKKKSWLLYLEAVKNLPPEEIAQMLFWQIKNMILLKTAKKGDNCGLNSFVAQKAAVAARNFSGSELKKLSSQLVAVFHAARRRDRDLALDLEKFVLQSL